MIHPYLYAGLEPSGQKLTRVLMCADHKRADKPTVAAAKQRLAKLARYSGYTLEDILHGTGHQDLVVVRQIIMYVLREDGYTLKDIAYVMHRDHTYVLYSHRKVRDAISIQDSLFATWWPRVLQQPFPPKTIPTPHHSNPCKSSPFSQA